MHRLTRNYYQICKVDHQRNQEQMVAEVERLNEAEKLVEKYLRNMNSSEKKDEISYRVTKMLKGEPANYRVQESGYEHQGCRYRYPHARFGRTA